MGVEGAYGYRWGIEVRTDVEGVWGVDGGIEARRVIVGCRVVC